MNIRARKTKGKQWQNKIRDLLIEKYPDLQNDIISTGMGQPGVDIVLSEAARKILPYSIEAKAHANGFTKSIDALEQAGRNRKENDTPVAIIKQTHKKPFVIMYLDDWIKII